MSETFFYTVETPYRRGRWWDGPTLMRMDPRTGEPIASLGRAEELALAERRSSRGEEDYTRTTYGSRFATPDLPEEGKR